jgi:hypothetical protein
MGEKGNVKDIISSSNGQTEQRAALRIRDKRYG